MIVLTIFTEVLLLIVVTHCQGVALTKGFTRQLQATKNNDKWLKH